MNLKIEHINAALNHVFDEDRTDWLEELSSFESYPEDIIERELRSEFASNPPDMIDTLVNQVINIAKQLS